MKKYIIILLAIIIGTSACVDEYTAKGIKDMSNILVVEGFISDDTTTVKLSKTLGINEDTWKGFPLVSDAVVEVECNDGTSFATFRIDTKIGEYKIPISTLDRQKQYRLKIEWQKEIYFSKYSHPIQTPEVGKIYWKKRGLGEMVTINIPVEIEEEIKYYNFSYEEIYQYRAEEYSNIKEIIGQGTTQPQAILYDDEETSLIYNCWTWNNSNTYDIISTNDYKIGEKVPVRILESEPSHKRFSILYYIKARKNQLSKTAYEYFSVLKKSTENSEDIFGPILSELKENITCSTNVSKKVIGYIDVSIIKEADLFIPYN